MTINLAGGRREGRGGRGCEVMGCDVILLNICLCCAVPEIDLKIDLN